MLVKGILLGFAVAAPVGPIGLLCIQRTLAHGKKHGFISGLGAAAADSVYGLLASLGITAITSILLTWQGWLQLVGGLFMLYFGWQTARTAPPEQVAAIEDQPNPCKAFFSIFFLTLANPATILAFFALFAGLGFGTDNNRQVSSALLLVLGIFLGSATWWLLLSFIAGGLRHQLAPSTLRVINLVSGCGIGALGLWAVITRTLNLS